MGPLREARATVNRVSVTCTTGVVDPRNKDAAVVTVCYKCDWLALAPLGGHGHVLQHGGWSQQL